VYIEFSLNTSANVSHLAVHALTSSVIVVGSSGTRVHVQISTVNFQDTFTIINDRQAEEGAMTVSNIYTITSTGVLVAMARVVAGVKKIFDMAID